MIHFLKKSLFAASISALALTCSGVMAQEVVFVLNTNEVGIPTYDPIKSGNTNVAHTLIYDRLVEQDAARNYHPHLATSWEEAPDGMSWIFHLKEGVTFHNGAPFNAATVAAWIPLYTTSDNSYMTAAIGSIEVIDDYTVKFVMVHPEPNLLYNLASSFMGVVEPAAYVAMGSVLGTSNTRKYRLGWKGRCLSTSPTDRDPRMSTCSGRRCRRALGIVRSRVRSDVCADSVPP